MNFCLQQLKDRVCIVVTITLYYLNRGRLFEIAHETWGIGDEDTRRQMSVMVTAAAWGQGEWCGMEEYMRSIPSGTFEGYFYPSLLHLHNNNFAAAQKVD